MNAQEKLKLIAERKGPSKEGLAEGAAVFAQAVGEELGVKDDEVAVLVLTSTGQTLKFVWPPLLAKSLAAFPADYKSAFASSVLTTMKGKVDNKLSASKHLRFYESVKGAEMTGLPIQRMIAVPLVHDDRAVGVVEVSRKGKTPEDSGAAFTKEDAQKLLAVCKAFTPALAALVPQPFL
jgi:hypothetical protein